MGLHVRLLHVTYMGFAASGCELLSLTAGRSKHQTVRPTGYQHSIPTVSNLGFPKTRGLHYGVPLVRITMYSDPCWGPPILAN